MAMAMAMATGEGSFKERDDILPGLRMVWSGKPLHLLHASARWPGPDPGRMDIIARLGERLR